MIIFVSYALSKEVYLYIPITCNSFVYLSYMLSTQIAALKDVARQTGARKDKDILYKYLDMQGGNVNTTYYTIDR